MALALDPVGRDDVLGVRRARYVDITFDNAYPTGGEVIPLADVGFTVLDLALVGTAKGLVFEVDYVNAKLKAVHPSGGAAQAGIADPSVAVPAGATAMTSSAAQPNLTETAGVGKEVGNGADLSTVTVRALLIGR